MKKKGKVIGNERMRRSENEVKRKIYKKKIERERERERERENTNP